MFTVTATFSFLNEDGTVSKPPVVETWVDIEKTKVVDQLEDRLLKFLLKLNKLSTEVNHGKLEKPSTTNPAEMRLEAVVLEDGKKWTRSIFEWPNMGEEQQATLLGLFYGELSTMDKKIVSEKSKGNKGNKAEKAAVATFSK